MSDALVVGIISAIVSLVGIFVASKNTRDSVTHKLDNNQSIMNTEITHIKETMSEMKADIKSHNQYARLFNENIPVIKEKIKGAERRIGDLEEALKHKS
jgi:peptidoglycan hydrolase CwlO-like protein